MGEIYIEVTQKKYEAVRDATKESLRKLLGLGVDAEIPDDIADAFIRGAIYDMLGGRGKE